MNGSENYDCSMCGSSPCRCAEEEGVKAVKQLKALEKNTNDLYFALISPKGFRLRFLRWLYPEIAKVADSLRECYWSNSAEVKDEKDFL